MHPLARFKVVSPTPHPSSFFSSHGIPSSLTFPERKLKKKNIGNRTLGGPSGAAGISSHGHSLLLLGHILEELLGALQLPAVDRLGGLAGVLERDAEVGAAGAGRL